MCPPSPETIDLLQQLVAFDTTSRNSNLPLIEFVRGKLESIGMKCQMVHSEDGRKANLLATIGPTDRSGILLSGHSDVVPVEGQRWRSDPFTVVERDGLLYGRGTADMKGFLAVILAAAPAFAATHLTEPLHIAITYDEEVGCLGVGGLIDAMSTMPFPPRLCIVGEPTDMQVAIGHKGAQAYRASFHGKAAHSSLGPLAVNAVEHAAELITRLTALGKKFSIHGPFDPGYDITHTTVHTGMIHGGTQVNIVPAHCEVDFEFRTLPQHDASVIEAQIQSWLYGDIQPSMQLSHSSCGIELNKQYGYPGLDTATDTPVVSLASELAGKPEPIKIAFGTEAGLYQTKLGVPSVVCGPGSISQAHQPDEFVSLEQLSACENFIEKLRIRMSVSGDRV